MGVEMNLSDARVWLEDRIQKAENEVELGEEIVTHSPLSDSDREFYGTLLAADTEVLNVYQRHYDAVVAELALRETPVEINATHGSIGGERGDDTR